MEQDVTELGAQTKIGDKPSACSTVSSPMPGCSLEGFALRGAGIDADARAVGAASTPRSV